MDGLIMCVKNAEKNGKLLMGGRFLMKTAASISPLRSECAMHCLSEQHRKDRV